MYNNFVQTENDRSRHENVQSEASEKNSIWISGGPESDSRNNSDDINGENKVWAQTIKNLRTSF